MNMTVVLSKPSQVLSQARLVDMVTGVRHHPTPPHHPTTTQTFKPVRCNQGTPNLVYRLNLTY